MNESPPPLRIDLRTILETVVAGLTFLMASIPTISLPDPYNVLGPLLIGALIIMINRLLGKNAADAVQELKESINRLVASNAVLKTDATPTVIRQADAAAVAISSPQKDAGKTPAEEPKPSP